MVEQPETRPLGTTETDKETVAGTESRERLVSAIATEEKTVEIDVVVVIEMIVAMSAEMIAAMSAEMIAATTEEEAVTVAEVTAAGMSAEVNEAMTTAMGATVGTMT